MENIFLTGIPGRRESYCDLSIDTVVNTASAGGRKRIFLGLLSASCLFLCLLLFVFLILPWFGAVTRLIEAASIAVGCIGIFLLIWLCLILVYHIYTGRRVPGVSGARHLSIRLLLPLMEMVGRIAGIDKNTVRRSFIKVNNEYVCSSAAPIPPQSLLVLLPHCIQASMCRRRLEPNTDHCAECGICQIGMIRKMAQRYGFKVAIATGGTIARRIVADMRPRQIIAVACERDLTSGIQDSYPLPVFGVLNERPNGPCRDTIVPFPALMTALLYFLTRDNAPAGSRSGHIGH